MADDPKITVIMPTYNRREFLPTALRCFTSQTFRDWRLMVINDGGEDVADLIAAAKDERIEYVNRPHAGKPAQLNFALANSQSKYVAYMDDDDVVFPEHLELLYNAAERLNSDFVYSDTWQIETDADGNCVSKTVENTEDATAADIRLFNRINHKQILHTRELSTRVGPYDEQMRILIDFDYIKRLIGAARNPFHLRKITGEHYLRAVGEQKGGKGAAITGLWKRDPAAAGRSLLRFFEKDPEALSMLYRLSGERDCCIRYMQERLDARLSARWRAWKHRNDRRPITPHDELPIEAEWRDCTPSGGALNAFALADEREASIAAVNRIAAGMAGEADAKLMTKGLTAPISSPEVAFAIEEKDGKIRFRYPSGTKMRWVMLCSKERLPQDFSLSFTYVPHSEFKEQLQLNFAMNSLGDRIRFVLRENRQLVLSRVVAGRFLRDDRVLPLKLQLDVPARVTLSSVQGVHSIAINGRTMLSMRTDETPAGYLAMIFYQDKSEGTIDFELGEVKIAQRA